MTCGPAKEGETRYHLSSFSKILVTLLLAAFMLIGCSIVIDSDDSDAASCQVAFVIKEHSDVYFSETGSNLIYTITTDTNGRLNHIPQLYRTDTLDYRFDGWFIENTDDQVTAETVFDGYTVVVDRWTYTPFDDSKRVTDLEINNPVLALGTKQGQYTATVATANVDGVIGGTALTLFKGLNASGDALVGDEEVEIGKNYSAVTTVTLKNGFKFDDQLTITADNGLAANEYFRGNFFMNKWSTDATSVEVIINFVATDDYYFIQQPDSREIENYAEYHYWYNLHEGAEELQGVQLQEYANDAWTLFGPATMVVSPYADTTKTFRLAASYQHGTIYSDSWTITWARMNPTIEDISLGVTAPKNGNAPSYAVTKEVRYTLADINDAYTQKGVKWSGSTSGDLAVGSSTFNSTEDYTVSFRLVAHDGYSFDIANLAATVNANAAVVTGDSSEVTVSYTFEAAKPTVYNVYFSCGQNGTGTMPNAVVNEGDEYILPANGFTPKSGYEFAAWSVSGNLMGEGDAVTVTGNMMVHAVWQSTSAESPHGFTTQPTGGSTATNAYFSTSFAVDNEITFDNVTIYAYDENSGTWGGVLGSNTIRVDDKITGVNFTCEEASSKLLRVYATNSGHLVAVSESFTVNWIDCEFSVQPQGASVLRGATYEFSWNTNLDVTRVRILCHDGADWSAIAETTGKSYSVTSITERTLTYQVCADISYINNAGIMTYAFDVAVSQTFTVTWTPTEFMVSYDSNGGSGTMVGDMVDVGQGFTLEDCTFEAPFNMRFRGWAIDSVDATPLKLPGDVIIINKTTIVYAIWEDVYTVTFAANGGTGTMDPVVTAGDYTLPGNSFTAPATKQFKCWSVSDVEKNVGDTINVTANVTVTAVWMNASVPTYTVTFAANGGTGTMDPVGGLTGQYTLPVCAFTAPATKQFKCWSVNDAEKNPGDQITVDANITVTALWKDTVAPEPEYDVKDVDGKKVYSSEVAAGADTNVTGIFNAAKTNSGSVDVKVGTMGIAFDSAAVNAIGGKTVSLKAEFKTTGLDVEGAQAVIEVTLEGASFSGGKATVTVPFSTAVPDGKVLKVYFINGSEKTDMDAVYENGQVVFTTNHFSKYAIMFEDAPSSGGNGGGFPIWIVIVIVVVVLAAGGAGAFFFMKNKKT